MYFASATYSRIRFRCGAPNKQPKGVSTAVAARRLEGHEQMSRARGQLEAFLNGRPSNGQAYYGLPGVQRKTPQEQAEHAEFNHTTGARFLRPFSNGEYRWWATQGVEKPSDRGFHVRHSRRLRRAWCRRHRPCR